MRRADLTAEFSALLEAYLHSDDEAQLYDASRLGRRLVEQEIGPEELVTVHLAAMQTAMRDLPPARVAGAVLKSYNLLLEAVMAYGLAYRDYVHAERRQAQQFAAHEQELRTIFDSMQEGLLLLDGAGRVRRANAAAARLIQLPDGAEVLGRRLEPSELPVLDVRIGDVARQAETGGPAVLEWETEQEGTAWQVVSRPFGAAEALVLLRDVTRQRALDRLKDEVVSVVSHELRTPMAVVLGFAELMVDRALTPEEMRAYAHEIHTHAGNLVALLNDFLDIQRLAGGHSSYRFAPTPLAPLCRRVVERLGRDATHQLVVDAPADLPLVSIDPQRIEQVVVNLVGNALKYSPQGGEIRLQARRVDDEVIVSIADQGLGLPPEAFPRLFEKFYRVDAPDRREIGGTGLGLAICRQIVEAHGGRIWAESAGVGRGSTFAFTFPSGQAVAHQPASRPPSREGNTVSL